MLEAIGISTLREYNIENVFVLAEGLRNADIADICRNRRILFKLMIAAFESVA